MWGSVSGSLIAVTTLQLFPPRHGQPEKAHYCSAWCLPTLFQSFLPRVAALGWPPEHQLLHELPRRDRAQGDAALGNWWCFTTHPTSCCEQSGRSCLRTFRIASPKVTGWDLVSICAWHYLAQVCQGPLCSPSGFCHSGPQPMLETRCHCTAPAAIPLPIPPVSLWAPAPPSDGRNGLERTRSGFLLTCPGCCAAC